MKLEKGLIQVYHGAGKGKSTAAFGLAVRAAGQGLKVCILQFMKESVAEAGEVESVKQLKNIELHRFGSSFIDRPASSIAEIRERVGRGIFLAKEAVAGGKFDLVIMDEINVAIHLKVADLEAVMEVIAAKIPEVELVLTGRYPPAEILEAADLVTEMNLVKHPFDKGIAARKGIEY